MRFPLTALIFMFMTAVAAVAQRDGEAAFLEDAADTLSDYASDAFGAGFPRVGREIWLEVLSEYDSDHPEARKRLGYVKVGTSWAPDPGFSFPVGDEPDVAAARALNRRWEKVADGLADDHAGMAERLGETENALRAHYHWQRVLRFDPGNGRASTALGMERRGRIVGSVEDLEVLDRSEMMADLVREQRVAEYEVETLPPDASHPLIARGGVACIGVKSESFTVWGNHPEDVLVEAAQWAERSLAFCQEAFDGYEGFPSPRGALKTLAFFDNRDDWAKVVRANEGQLGGASLEFVVQNTSSVSMGHGEDRIKIAGFPDVATVHDLAVRTVATTWSGLSSDAMVEGLGHAVVGMFFGRNLVFSVADLAADGRTSTRREPDHRLLLPDMETWKQLALEAAFDRSGTPAAELPLLRASEFPEDARIKAWSFCDYLLRRDPTLMLALDRTRTKARNPNAVAANFRERTDIALHDLEEAWRRYWTGAAPVTAAIHDRGNPLDAVSKGAREWLAVFNEQRRRLGKEPVEWSAQLSVACKAHAEYLASNRRARGPVRAHRQDPESDEYTPAGATLAPNALVATGRIDPEDTVESWLDLPGYRDVLLAPDLRVIGVYVARRAVVLDGVRGRVKQQRVPVQPWPNNRNNQNNAVPSSIELERLGSTVAGALREAGLDPVPDEIGYPLTMHFGASTPDPRSLACSVRANGKEVRGVLVRAWEGGPRPVAAAGLLVFYPFEPFVRGAEVEAEWHYRTNGASGPTKVKFRTK